MTIYIVQWDYRSSLGSFNKGDEIDLDQATADLINRDSPKVLKEKRDPKSPPPERTESPKADRQARGGANRKTGE